MPKWNLRGVFLECVQGDIARQPDVQAVVNAANAELRMGGGVAGAIHRAAGPELDRACRDLAPIRPGEAVITGAYELPADWFFAPSFWGPNRSSTGHSSKGLSAFGRNSSQNSRTSYFPPSAMISLGASCDGCPIPILSFTRPLRRSGMRRSAYSLDPCLQTQPWQGICRHQTSFHRLRPCRHITFPTIAFSSPASLLANAYRLARPPMSWLVRRAQ